MYLRFSGKPILAFFLAYSKGIRIFLKKWFVYSIDVVITQIDGPYLNHESLVRIKLLLNIDSLQFIQNRLLLLHR